MLQAIVDHDAARAAGWEPVALASALLAGGVRFIQVRAKSLPSDELLQLCDAVVDLARPFGAAVVVNDRADIALMSRATGVHVGQHDLPVTAARELLGPGAIIGYSTHTIEQVGQAVTLPASYIAVGPVFSTASKETGYSPVGLELVRDRTTKERATSERDTLVRECFTRGLLVLGAGRNAIRLSPPLVLTKEQADTAIDILDQAGQGRAVRQVALHPFDTRTRRLFAAGQRPHRDALDVRLVEHCLSHETRRTGQRDYAVWRHNSTSWSRWITADRGE